MYKKELAVVQQLDESNTKTLTSDVVVHTQQLQEYNWPIILIPSISPIHKLSTCPWNTFDCKLINITVTKT